MPEAQTKHKYPRPTVHVEYLDSCVCWVLAKELSILQKLELITC